MRQCEFKKRYDPDMDMYLTKHIEGEGITDIFKTVGKKILGKTAKKAAKRAAKKAVTATSEYVGKKAGDKIVELLSKNKSPSVQMEPDLSISPKELTAQEVNDRVNQILSGGKLKRRNFI